MRTENRETPQDLFDELNEEFHFTLDPCATAENHKCDRWISEEEDGLKSDWGGQRVFCNPPYKYNKEWVKKAYYESRKPDTVVVLLIPSRTDTQYFHNYIYHRAEIRFLEGRLRFGNSSQNAPFASMLVIFRGPKNKKEK